MGAVKVKGAPPGHRVPTGTTAGTVAAGDDARFGGGGGAPTTASYVVVGLDGTLTAERRLQVSADLSLTDGGANGDITVGLAAGVYKAGGTDVAVADGGTGASTAAGARTNLGLAIGSDVAGYDAGLASLATVDTAADLLPYTTAANTWAATSLTAAGRSMLAAATAAAQLELITPTTTKGDVLVDDGAALVRLAVGSDGQVLAANSTTSTGLKWTNLVAFVIATGAIGNFVTLPIADYLKVTGTGWA